MKEENPLRCALCGSLNPEVYDPATKQMVCLVCMREDHPDIEELEIDPDDVYVLEYSEIEYKAGRYPLHYCKQSQQHPPGPGGWKVIALGNLEGILKKLKESHNKLFG